MTYLEEIKIFIELVKSEICGKKIPSSLAEKITLDNLIKIYPIAQKHDMIHIVAMALKRNQLFMNEKIYSMYQQCLRYAIYRHEMKRYEYEQICNVLEDAQIAYVPLKGAVICKYYPESWMRTSSDIDILVREEDLQKAKERIVSRLRYTVLKHNYHDISMVSPQKQLFELHFRILENEKNIDLLLDKVWDYVYIVESGCFEYAMQSEFFVFHAMAHMLYHFKNGGCGVRFLVDYWLLQKKMEYDAKTLKRMYKMCGIETFASSMDRLVDIWFGDAQHDQITEKIEQYIIEGGLFGTIETKVRSRKTKIEGKYCYILGRIWQPYHELKVSYPKLEKYPVLYLYYVVKRWGKIFHKEDAKRFGVEMRLHSKMNQDRIYTLKGLFEYLKI